MPIKYHPVYLTVSNDHGFKLAERRFKMVETLTHSHHNESVQRQCISSDIKQNNRIIQRKNLEGMWYPLKRNRTERRWDGRLENHYTTSQVGVHYYRMGCVGA
jgi:hypothetical protein